MRSIAFNKHGYFFMTHINIIPFLLCLFVLSVASSQESTEDLLGQLKDGQHSVGLYEQLGHKYYEDGDLAHARLYYEKAFLLKPRDKSIREAIDYLKDGLQIQITDIPDFVLVRYYRQVAQMLSPLLWSILQLSFAIGIVYFSYRYLLSTPKDARKRGDLIAIGGFVLFTLISGLLAYKSRSLSEGGVSAVVMSTQSLYTAPDERSEVIADLGPGNKVELVDQIDDWIKVQLADKDVGWIKQELIKEI